MRVFVLVLAVGLAACVAPHTQIVGPYASRLSAADVHEITSVGANNLARLHIRVTGPPEKLQVLRPDYVQVDMPVITRDPGTCSFDMMKRQGHWIVDGHGGGGGVGGQAPGENVVVE
jgi:hypothetical protein